ISMPRTSMTAIGSVSSKTGDPGAAWCGRTMPRRACSGASTTSRPPERGSGCFLAVERRLKRSLTPPCSIFYNSLFN
ncbi:MAG: hypothetical protein QW172_05105, partial [Candidatus Bathyarchaeia archaeon]